MAVPSSLYAEDENARQTLANGTVLKWTNQLKNIYTINKDSDLSIVYTNWDDRNVLTKATKTPNNFYPTCDISAPSLGANQSGPDNVATGWTRRETGSPRVDNIFSGVVLCNGNSGSYHWGYNPLKTAPVNQTSGGDARLLLDMDINKMIFGVHFSAIDLTQIPTIEDYSANPKTSHYPATVTISLKELYDNPDKYGIVSYTWDSCYVYGENTSDHWRTASIKPAFIMDNGDSIGGFNALTPFGSYSGVMQLSFSLPNGEVSPASGSSTLNILNHLEEKYIMGHPYEFVLKPDNTYDGIGQSAMGYYASEYGVDTAGTHRMFVDCNTIEFDDLIYVGESTSNVQQTVTPTYSIRYLDLQWSWHRLIKGSTMLKYFAAYGLYFRNDQSFDPDSANLTPETLGDSDKIWLGEMGTNGVTTGNWITDLDSYTGPNKDGKTTNPDYDPSGGGGGGGGGYDDDPWHGISFSGVGVGGAGAFAKCYYMTSTELANLRSWMNSNNVPEGFDPMAQIIGLSQVPVSLSGDDNTTVQFVNSSAVYDPGVTRLVDSGVNTQISMGTPKRYSLGSVDITRRMQERGEPYLDYDCQIELYLPLIGMFSLDTQAVMGRTITAEAVLDPISGTLAAYAYVTRDGQNLPIAYGSTTIGVDLPISAQQYSVSRAALKQANAQLGTSLLSSTLSFIAAATAGGKGSGTGAKTATGSTNGLAAAGIREAGADYMKASQAGNVFGDFMQWGRTIRQLSYGNNTAIAGSFGGSTAQWSYPFTPYVKIIRPRYEKPSNYNHSQGVPCVQAKTVGSCTGFIQCIGVDVSGITGATDIELQAIQAALTNGVFAGGGS